MNNTNTDINLSLKQVYDIFSRYWNEKNRMWVHTINNEDYNIKLSLNDFLHFSQIDKILKLKNMNFKRKNNYIRNKITKDELNFITLEQSLRNSNQHKHFSLKKNAIIALAINICTQKSLFNKITHDSNYLFPKVKPDFILINELNVDRYIMHCNYIRIHNDYGLKNLAHPKSIMYCYSKHQRYNLLDDSKCININKTKFIKNKGNSQ